MSTLLNALLAAFKDLPQVGSFINREFYAFMLEHHPVSSIAENGGVIPSDVFTGFLEHLRSSIQSPISSLTDSDRGQLLGALRLSGITESVRTLSIGNKRKHSPESFSAVLQSKPKLADKSASWDAQVEMELRAGSLAQPVTPAPSTSSSSETIAPRRLAEINSRLSRMPRVRIHYSTCNNRTSICPFCTWVFDHAPTTPCKHDLKSHCHGVKWFRHLSLVQGQAWLRRYPRIHFQLPDGFPSTWDEFLAQAQQLIDASQPQSTSGSRNLRPRQIQSAPTDAPGVSGVQSVPNKGKRGKGKKTPKPVSSAEARPITPPTTSNANPAAISESEERGMEVEVPAPDVGLPDPPKEEDQK